MQICDTFFLRIISKNQYLCLKNTFLIYGNSIADYRIRVGVQDNSPNIPDIGMFRNWNINDTTYLRTPTSRDFVAADVTGTRNIAVTPDYIAPKDLFR